MLISGNLYSQSNPLIADYRINNYSDPIISGDSLFIPVRSSTKEFQIHVAALKDNQIARVYLPPTKMSRETSFTIEDGFIYYHVSGKLSKYEMRNNKRLWEVSYSSKWGAQWEPVILGKYVISIVDDTILVVDKTTGTIIQEIKGKGFEDGISLSGNYLIGTKAGGQTFAIDLSTGKKKWGIDVGDEAGYGSVTDNNNLYLPSWDPKFYCVDRETGKPKWTLDLRKIKNGCGSGFEEAPVMFGPNLYAVHRDHGLFIINKSNGNVEEVHDLKVNIVDNVAEYGGNLIFCSNNYLHIFSIKENKELKRLALPAEVLSGVTLQNNYAIIGQGNKYKKSSIVLVYDLDKALTQ